MGGKIYRTWLGSETTVEQRFRQKRWNKRIDPHFYRRSLARHFYMDAMGSDRPHSDTQMRPLEKIALRLSLTLILGVAAFQTLALAHAFPVRSDPSVGWTLP